MKKLSAVLKQSKSFASLLGNGISAFLGVLSFAILARYLSKEEFGQWLLFIASYSIFETLRVGMILNAFIRNFAQASGKEEEKIVVGSSLLLTIILTVLYLLFLGILYGIFYYFNIYIEYLYLFKWYALAGLLTLPHNFGTWYLNASMKMIIMSVIRIINQLIFIALVVVFFYYRPGLDMIFYAFAISHLLTSLIALLMGWTGMNQLFEYSLESIKKIYHFGKYSMGTLIGSNLLKNSDSFIIGKMLNTLSVAVYNVPMRVLEMIDIPIRSYAVANYPLLSKVHSEGRHELLRHEFERKTGFITLLLLPLSVLCFVFADQIVVLIAGDVYADSAILLRLFSIYSALTPLDRLSGVMLDIINKPEMNFVKVLLMLFVNILGDILAIKYFGNLESVAIVSTFTFVTGMVFGFYLLKKYINISVRNVFKLGLNVWSNSK